MTFVVTPIPALLSGLMTLSAHVYLFTRFPCGQQSFLLCSSPLFVLLYTLSVFLLPGTSCSDTEVSVLLPLITFTVTACVLMPAPGAFHQVTSSPFTSTQYLYCSSVQSFFACTQYLLPRDKRSFLPPPCILAAMVSDALLYSCYCILTPSYPSSMFCILAYCSSFPWAMVYF
jgi:hypothetical protein